jgi:hypothetical protein
VNILTIKTSALTIACLLFVASATQAATLINFEGNATTNLAMGTGEITLSADGTTLTGFLTNTSPFDARIMSFGFDVGSGNLNGYTGSADMGFVFSDSDFGNVPQAGGSNTVQLDFGAAVNCTIAKDNCDFAGGGSPNNGLDYLETVNFSVTGDFGSLTEDEIAAALFVRFQRVGPNGQLSDVATVIDTPGNPTPVPEPASMLLFGTGLAYLARRRMRNNAI